MGWADLGPDLALLVPAPQLACHANGDRSPPSTSPSPTPKAWSKRGALPRLRWSFRIRRQPFMPLHALHGKQTLSLPERQRSVYICIHQWPRNGPIRATARTPLRLCAVPVRGTKGRLLRFVGLSVEIPPGMQYNLMAYWKALSDGNKAQAQEEKQ